MTTPTLRDALEELRDYCNLLPSPIRPVSILAKAAAAIAQQGVPEDAALADLQKEVDTLRSLLNARPAMNAGLPVAYAEWTGMVYAHSMGLLDAPSQTH